MSGRSHSDKTDMSLVTALIGSNNGSKECGKGVEGVSKKFPVTTKRLSRRIKALPVMKNLSQHIQEYIM